MCASFVSSLHNIVVDREPSTGASSRGEHGVGKLHRGQARSMPNTDPTSREGRWRGVGAHTT